MFQIYIPYASNGRGSTMSMNAWCTDTSILAPINTGTWIFVAYSINGSSTSSGDSEQTGWAFYNNKLYTATTGPYNISTPSTIFYIANPFGSSYYFQGYISNVQIYNFELSTSQINSSAEEGVGGKPIATSGLVAWYPINGSLSSYLVSNNPLSNYNAVFTSNYGS